MWNNAMKKKLEAALKRLNKCDGDCKHCEKCHMYFHDTPHIIYYAFGCDNLPTEEFSAISDSMSDLRKDVLETVKFELSLS